MIKINENYVIDSDDNQVILKEKRVVQEGKTAGSEVWDTLGYFSGVGQAAKCLEKILQRRAIREKDYTLKEFGGVIKKIHEDIFKIVGE